MFTLEYANLARHGGKPEPALDILCFFQSPKHSSLFSFDLAAQNSLNYIKTVHSFETEINGGKNAVLQP